MRHLAHLSRRFFGSLVASRPSPGEQTDIARLLSPEEARVFWSQPVADLAHAMRGVRSLSHTAPGRDDLLKAFLLHDVGKRHARLGTLGRSVATALSWLGLARGERQRAYMQHGEAGARELEDLGSDGLVVAFARWHHHAVPDGCDPEDWALLVAADGV